MNKRKLFKAAQRIAAKKAEELDCSCVIQSGSSLRKGDFAPGSDLDMMAICEGEPDERWSHDFDERVEVSVMWRSKEEFLENLEAGNPFELMALRFGEVRKDDGFLESLEASSYEPTERTVETWIRSGLNQYSRMLEDRNLPLDFHNAAYHSFRSFSRILILEEENELFERDRSIKKKLEGIGEKPSEYFWSLREKRMDPPDLEYIEMDELGNDRRSGSLKKVEHIGRKVLSRRGKEFPSFGKLNGLLKERGYKIFGSFLTREEGVQVSGVNEEDHEIFEFNLETGELRPLQG